MHIPFLQALYATCYGHANGPEADLFNLADISATDGAKFEAHRAVVSVKPGLVESPLEMGSDARATVPADAATFRDLGKKIRNAGAGEAKATECLKAAKAIAATVLSGVWCPVEIVIARPFIEHLMLSGIVTVSGRDTGATLFGPAGTLLHAIIALSLFHFCTHTHICYGLPRFRFALDTGSNRVLYFLSSASDHAVNLRTGILSIHTHLEKLSG